MNALIGHTGLIGTVLGSSIEFDHVYNSGNIDQIKNLAFDTVYCAAPSGNRMLANLRPEWDTNSVQHLTDCLKTVAANRFVLISTVDTVHAPETVYGGNRLALECFVQTQFDCCHIVRLCTLIHPTITKNLLFDIRHRCYLDQVNGAQIRQYYSLQRLAADIDTVLKHDLRVVNLVSEPVSDQEIMSRFCPDCTVQSQPVRPYDLHSTEPFGQYVLTKHQVFNAVSEYIND